MAILEIEKLSLKMHGVQILKDISIQVSAGEIISVIGPNGAGKSSLLRAIIGDIKAEASCLKICGQALHAWDLRDRAKHLAMLPQDSPLNFPFRVEDVVALGRSPHDSGVNIDNDIISETMSLTDISYLSGRLYTELSGGEKQRVQLARVFAQIWRKEDAAERLLLLDEPLTALDLGHQQQLLRGIRELAAKGVAVILVLHDINLAINHSDRILALACGQMEVIGKSEAVIDEHLLKRLFGGEVQLITHQGRKLAVI